MHAENVRLSISPTLIAQRNGEKNFTIQTLNNEILFYIWFMHKHESNFHTSNIYLIFLDYLKKCSLYSDSSIIIDF